MAYRIRNLTPFLLIFIFATSWADAQEEPPPLYEFSFYVASGSRIRNVRFGKFDDSGTMIGSSPMGFRSSGRSLKYEYRGILPLVFFEETPAPTPENPDNVTRTPVAVATPPENIENVIFLFSKNPRYPEAGQKYLVDWVDLDHEKIPAGHITIFNTLPLTIRGGVAQDGDQPPEVISVSRGINSPIKISPKATVLLTLETEEDGLLRAYEDTIYCEPDERVLLVIFPPRFRGSYKLGSKIISIPSAQAEEEEETEAADES